MRSFAIIVRDYNAGYEVEDCENGKCYYYETVTGASNRVKFLLLDKKKVK